MKQTVNTLAFVPGVNGEGGGVAKRERGGREGRSGNRIVSTVNTAFTNQKLACAFTHG